MVWFHGATDLCHICQSNVVKIVRSANLPDSEKSQNGREAENHLKLAIQERKMYTDECLQATMELKLYPKSPKVVHCSFDFAQQIFIPSTPQQVGPLYFLAPRKCQLFGVCSEAKGEQVHYLIHENDNPGKGASCVVSLVHHYLESRTSVGQHLLLHANNAVGQNKNNTVIQYLAWRVLTGCNPTIKLSFMIPGHTKFAPDQFFGLVKKLYRRTSVSSLHDIEDVGRSLLLRTIPLPPNRQRILRQGKSTQIHIIVWRRSTCLLSNNVATSPTTLHTRRTPPQSNWRWLQVLVGVL